MKRIMIVVCAVCMTMAVTAQHGRGAGRGQVIIVSPSIGFGYSPYYASAFGYSPFGYSPFGSPFGYYRPSGLDMKVSDIKADYKDKIKSARHDESISKDEQKKIVAQLKSERDKSIHDLKANYYKQKTAATAPENKG